MDAQASVIASVFPIQPGSAALVWRPRENATSATPGFFKILGLHADAPVSFATLLEQAHPEDADALGALMGLSMRTHSPFHVKHRIRLDDGTTRWVETLAKFATDARENLDEVCLVVDYADEPE